ncbi:unnamed protein product [[Actinomadura] parvosata subsp. kistnae]|nr:unnamed protein product [Actinomadura parvosata subsp. kistnae]
MTLTSLLVCIGGAVVTAVAFIALGYYGRFQQRHYGHYPHEAQDEVGDKE